MVAVAVGGADGIISGLEAGLIATGILALVFGPVISLTRLIGHRILSRLASVILADYESLRGRLHILLAQLAYALVVAALFGLSFGIPAGVQGGLRAGISGFEASFLVGRRGVPERVNARKRGRLVLLIRYLAGGIWLGVVYGLIVAATLGVTDLATSMFADAVIDRGLSTRQVVVALITAALGLIIGIVSGIARSVALWLNKPVNLVTSPSPTAALRNSRMAAATWAIFTIFVLEGMVAIGIKFGDVASSDPVRYGVAYGVPLGIVGGLLALTVSTWGEFVVVRMVLAKKGSLPLRLVGFLDDGRARGVFRQAGAAYQFRHSRLREQLAHRDQLVETMVFDWPYVRE